MTNQNTEDLGEALALIKADADETQNDEEQAQQSALDRKAPEQSDENERLDSEQAREEDSDGERPEDDKNQKVKSEDERSGDKQKNKTGEKVKEKPVDANPPEGETQQAADQDHRANSDQAVDVLSDEMVPKARFESARKGFRRKEKLLEKETNDLKKENEQLKEQLVKEKSQRDFLTQQALDHQLPDSPESASDSLDEKINELHSAISEDFGSTAADKHVEVFKIQQMKIKQLEEQVKAGSESGANGADQSTPEEYRVGDVTFSDKEQFSSYLNLEKDSPVLADWFYRSKLPDGEIYRDLFSEALALDQQWSGDPEFQRLSEENPHQYYEKLETEALKNFKARDTQNQQSQQTDKNQAQPVDQQQAVQTPVDDVSSQLPDSLSELPEGGSGESGVELLDEIDQRIQAGASVEDLLP